MKQLLSLISGPQILEVGYVIDESHTNVILPEKDGSKKNIIVSFTDDAEAAAFLIGYSAKLQQMTDGKYVVSPQLNGTMINYLIGISKDMETVRRILNARDKGMKKAEQYKF